jgi:HJR/Mrr/RecB family endonuclease
MSDTRSDIAKLIERVRRDESLLDSLSHHKFESMAAELIAQQLQLVDLKHQALGGLDIVGRYRDQLDRVSSFAIDVKRYSHLVDGSTVAELAKKAAAIGVDKSYLFSASSFTETARQYAEQYRESLRLVDRTHIQEMIEQYTSNREVFASSIAARIRSLDLINFIEVSEPTADDVEQLDLDRPEFGVENRSAIILAQRLPLQLLAKILRSPQDVRNITPRQFEEFIAEVLSQLGFTDVILTPRSRDGGKDIIASHQVNGIPLAFYFECKQYAEGNKIQLDTMRALLGTIAHDSNRVNKGVLVTTSSFTKGCRELILSEARLDGKDYEGVLGWIDEVRKRI